MKHLSAAWWRELPERLWRQWRLETAFVLIAGSYGLLWIFIYPPFQIPDGRNMFCRAYQVSQGNLWGGTRGHDPFDVGYTSSEQSADKASGAMLPASIHTINHLLDWRGIALRPDQAISLRQMRMAMQVRIEPEKEEFYAFANSLNYSPVAFLPQAIGIGIGRLLDLPVVALVWLARLGNLIVYLVAVTCALRLLPTGRHAFFVLALLPISLQQAISPSADNLQLCASWLFLAYVLHWRAREGAIIGRRQLVILCGLAALVASAKLIYGFLVLPVLLLPVERFSSRGRQLGTWLGVLAAGFFAVVSWAVILKLTSAPHVDQATNPMLTALLGNPLLIFQFMWENLQLNASVGRTWWGFVGVLGYLDTPVPVPVFVAYLLLGLTALLAVRPLACKRPLLWPLGVLAIGALQLTVIHLTLGIFLQSLYVIQSRYYLPFLFLLVVAWALSRGPHVAGLRGPRRVPGLAYGVAIVIALGMTTVTLLTRYYQL